MMRSIKLVEGGLLGASINDAGKILIEYTPEGWERTVAIELTLSEWWQLEAGIEIAIAEAREAAKGVQDVE